MYGYPSFTPPVVPAPGLTPAVSPMFPDHPQVMPDTGVELRHFRDLRAAVPLSALPAPRKTLLLRAGADAAGLRAPRFRAGPFAAIAVTVKFLKRTQHGEKCVIAGKRRHFIGLIRRVMRETGILQQLRQFSGQFIQPLVGGDAVPAPQAAKRCAV